MLCPEGDTKPLKLSQVPRLQKAHDVPSMRETPLKCASGPEGPCCAQSQVMAKRYPCATLRTSSRGPFLMIFWRHLRGASD